jgi:hypothetical protein
MPVPSARRALRAAPATAALALFAGLLIGPAGPARAAELFADDFEQSSGNVWQAAGGAFSRVSDGTTTVFAQPDATRDATVLTAAGVIAAAPGAATVVSARVRPTSGLGAAGGRIGVVARAAHHNNHYYAVLRHGALEIGTKLWGTVTPLASAEALSENGAWFTLTLRLGRQGGVISASAVAPDGASTTVTAADPGGTGFGDRVGLWTQQVAGEFDDVRFDDDTVAPPVDPAAPCPVQVRFSVPAEWPGSFQGQFTLTNPGTAPVGPGWRISWRFTSGQKVSTAFSVGLWYQRGDTVTARNPVWWATIPPGSTVSFGFVATGQGRAYPPADVTVNGVRCALTA